MRDTDYAFCVARLRAKETDLLNNDFIEKLIETKSFDETVKLLKEIGWIEASDTYTQAIKKHKVELWNTLSESVPDKKALDSLCVLNDYFNIKAAVKCAITGEDATQLYVYPTSLDVRNLVSEIKQKSIVNMSSDNISCTYQAYELAVKTENGQNVDIYVDRCALDALMKYGQKSGNVIFSKVCNFIADTSNIKTSIRCAIAKKSTDFINLAISHCDKLDRDKLIKYSSQDIDELYDYLLSSEYRDGIKLYKRSPAAFEKWCDDRIIDIIKGSKYIAFGFAPVCAYYYAKLTEIKAVRILLSSKLSGISNEAIRERVRNLYV